MVGQDGLDRRGASTRKARRGGQRRIGKKAYAENVMVLLADMKKRSEVEKVDGDCWSWTVMYSASLDSKERGLGGR